MHPSVTAVHRTFNPTRSYDKLLWTKEKGLLVKVKRRNNGNWIPGEDVAHGSEAWAEAGGRPRRLKVVFDLPSGEFVFPEQFRILQKHRREERLAQRAMRKMDIDRAYSLTLQSGAHVAAQQAPAA